MKIVYFLKKNLLLGFLVLATTTNYNVLAEIYPDKNDTKALALRQIMSEMGKNMQAIVANISQENWKQVEKYSSKIAEHPQPPFIEKIKIVNYAGSHIGKFKNYNNKTHNAAISLSKAAEKKDGFKVILEFSNLQKMCLSCHQYFRKDFIEYFYH